MLHSTTAQTQHCGYCLGYFPETLQLSRGLAVAALPSASCSLDCYLSGLQFSSGLAVAALTALVAALTAIVEALAARGSNGV